MTYWYISAIFKFPWYRENTLEMFDYVIITWPVISGKNPYFFEILETIRNTMQKTVCQYLLPVSRKLWQKLYQLKKTDLSSITLFSSAEKWIGSRIRANRVISKWTNVRPVGPDPLTLSTPIFLNEFCNALKLLMNSCSCLASNLIRFSGIHPNIKHEWWRHSLWFEVIDYDLDYDS